MHHVADYLLIAGRHGQHLQFIPRSHRIALWRGVYGASPFRSLKAMPATKPWQAKASAWRRCGDEIAFGAWRYGAGFACIIDNARQRYQAADGGKPSPADGRRLMMRVKWPQGCVRARPVPPAK